MTPPCYTQVQCICGHIIDLSVGRLSYMAPVQRPPVAGIYAPDFPHDQAPNPDNLLSIPNGPPSSCPTSTLSSSDQPMTPASLESLRPLSPQGVHHPETEGLLEEPRVTYPENFGQEHACVEPSNTQHQSNNLFDLVIFEEDNSQPVSPYDGQPLLDAPAISADPSATAFITAATPTVVDYTTLNDPRTPTDPSPSALLTPSTPRVHISHGHKSGVCSSRSRVWNPKKSRMTPSTIATAIATPCLLRQYGCHATFFHKNEWKRHLYVQHLRLYIWRCDLCPTNAAPHSFARKDLFVTHVRRMHSTLLRDPKEPKLQRQRQRQRQPKNLPDGPNPISTTETPTTTPNRDRLPAVAELAERCRLRFRPDPPPAALRCPVPGCDDASAGDGMAQRVEHLATHLREKRTGMEGLQCDSGLEAWLVRQGVLVAEKTKMGRGGGGSGGGGWVLRRGC